MPSLLFHVLVLTQFSVILTVVPNLSRKCKLSDSECLKTVAQEALPIVATGMPELGTAPLDVMYIEERKFNIARLKLSVIDAYIKGLKNGIIKNISFDMANNTLIITYQTDMGLKSKYKASGQLLVLPISGAGDMTIDLKNFQLEMVISFQIIKNKDGKDTLALKGYRFKYDVIDGASFYLSNLFNGNSEMSNKLLKFINDKWTTITVEFGRPMLEEVLKNIFDVIKSYLQSQPLQDFIEN